MKFHWINAIGRFMTILTLIASTFQFFVGNKLLGWIWLTLGFVCCLFDTSIEDNRYFWGVRIRKKQTSEDKK